MIKISVNFDFLKILRSKVIELMNKVPNSKTSSLFYGKLICKIRQQRSGQNWFKFQDITVKSPFSE